MKTYETVWEIFNQCSGNQMRDVFIDEIEVEDTDAYIENKFKDNKMVYQKEILEDGTIVYNIDTSGIKQKFSFTEI